MSQPSEPEPYWLGRASDEQKRLLKQHAAWTKSVSHLLAETYIRPLPTLT
jgi:hypothetical protein